MIIFCYEAKIRANYLCAHHWGMFGSRGTDPLIRKLWSVSRIGHFTLGKSHQCPSIRRLFGP